MFKAKRRTEKKQAVDNWHVMIVDDEPEVHTITKIVLDDFSFKGRGIEFMSAYGADEAKQLIAKHTNTAIIFLDVVMEEDDSGLKVVKYIREELGNQFVRIILRTGQPGQNPEHEVIVNYDINDYREKTSLDSTKMFTVTYSAIRAYCDIRAVDNARIQLESDRTGLEKIISVSANLFAVRSLKRFSSGLLAQLSSLLHIRDDITPIQVDGLVAVKSSGGFNLLASSGIYEKIDSHDAKLGENEVFRDYFSKAIEAEKSLFIDDKFVGFFHTTPGQDILLLLCGCHDSIGLDRQLIKVFLHNVTIAFKNLFLGKELENTQVELIHILGEVVESRSKEAANHVTRIAEFSYIVARNSGFSEEECDMLKQASPMHDVGKIGIPDAILLKPGKLDEAEFEIMKTHAMIGYDILKNSERPLLKTAAIIAKEHHEKYNGKGYPAGLIGDEIHPFARIVAITDVFDALTHKRCYKESWPLEKTISLLKENRGEHFDPRFLDAFLDNLDEILKIDKMLP